MIKEKKCKGHGVAKGFGCGKMIDVKFRVYGLGKMCRFIVTGKQIGRAHV